MLNRSLLLICTNMVKEISGRNDECSEEVSVDIYINGSKKMNRW